MGDFFLEGANWFCFFAKKQNQFAPSKESFCHLSVALKTNNEGFL